MKKLLFALALISTVAYGQHKDYYDGSGAYIGESDTKNGVTTYYGSNGAFAGEVVSKGSKSEYWGANGAYKGESVGSSSSNFYGPASIQPTPFVPFNSGFPKF